MSEKIIINWKIKTASPVHIGGSPDSHWESGIDYLMDGGRAYFLDPKKVIEEYTIDQFSDALTSRTLHRLIDRNQLNQLSASQRRIDGKTREIKQCIKNSLSQKPIIPGSSLKGSIRSVLLKYFIKNNPSLRNERGNIEQKIFGTIGKDFMRYIQVADIEFDHTELYNTKILNLTERDGYWRSNWKNEFRGGNNTRFDENKFTTGYECIKKGSEARLRMVFNYEQFKKAAEFNSIHYINGLHALFNDQFEENLFSIIREHTISFLDKEIEFLKQDLQADHIEGLLEDYQMDIETLTKDTVAPLRLAAGSGFHSITGDWIHTDHLVDNIDIRKRNRGTRNHKNSAKSRRFAFTKDEDGYYYFYPMGYIGFIRN